MKKYLLLLLFAALLMPWTAKAQIGDDNIVANGTEENDFVPFYPFYADSPQRTQTIYPASLLTAIQGKSITDLQYYLSSPGENNLTSTFTVKIGVVAESGFTSTTFNTTTLTTVYTGLLDVTNDVMTIHFTTPFAYTSGNLLVEISQTSGNQYTMASFYGITSTGAALSYYNDTYGDGDTYEIYDFLPKTNFMTPSSCPRVTINSPTHSETGTTITWTENGSATSWAVSLDNGPVTVVNTPSYTATGLGAMTTHTVSVSAICGAGDTSTAATTTFRTPCGFITVTTSEAYFEDFNSITGVTYDGAGSLPDCWESYNPASSGNYGPHVVNGTSYHYSPDNTNSLGMTSGSSSYGNPKIAVLPSFTNDLNTMQISFWMATESSSNGTLDVGYVTGTDFATTFHSIRAIPASTSTYYSNGGAEQVIVLSGIPAEATNLALRWTYNSSYFSVCIDNLMVEIQPTCPRPMDAAVTAVDANSATFGWTSTAAGHEVRYRAQGETDWTVSSSLSISGLTANSAYEFQGRDICGAGDTSLWSNAQTFRTPCEAVALPYSMDFTGIATGSTGGWPDCWTKTQTYTSGSTVYPYISSTGNPSTSIYMYASSSRPNMVSTPMLPINANQAVLTFNAKTSSSTASYLLMVGVITNPTDPNSFVAVDTITGAQNGATWKSYEYDLSTVSAIAANTTKIIAFKWAASSSGCYIDNVYIEQSPECKKPSDLAVSNITGTSADITWNEMGIATSYVLTVNGGTPVTLNTTSYAMTNLEPNTAYTVSVSGICGSDTTRAAVVEFRTPCTSSTLPYSEDFENFTAGTGTTPDCWTKITGSSYIRNDSTYAHSGTKSYQIYGPGIVVTPMIAAPANKMVLSLWAKAESTTYSGNLRVGFTTNPTSTASTIWLDTILSNTAYSYVEIPTDGLTTTDQGYFVFQQINTTSTNYYWWIDDIMVERWSDCTTPADLTATVNETGDGATLTWTGTANSYVVRYSNGGNWTTANTTANTLELTGLRAASTYTVQVFGICGTDTSRTASTTFTTACGIVTITQTEPFVENFNTYTNAGTYSSSTTMPQCWNTYTTASNYGPHVVSSDSYWYSPDNSPSLGMTAGEETYGTPKIAVLPEFTNALNTLQMYFWMKTESSSSGTLDVGYVTSDDYVGTFTSIQTIPASNGTYSGTEYDVYLDQVPATATNLAFRWTYNSSYYSVCLDNITVSIGSDCHAVSNPTVMSTTPTSATLSWTGCDAATGYQIIYGTSNNIANVTTDTVEAATTTGTITGLATETTYYAWVRSICNGETTRWVAAGSFTTDVACAPVENIRVLNGTFTSATIGWDINANVGYASTEVEFSYKPASASTWTTDYTTNNYYFLTGLTEGTRYNVRILNICSDDTSSAATYTFSTGTCGEIGDGSTTVSSVPFYGLYNYGYTQTIYPASEVGAVDTIFGISYNVASTSTRSRTIDVYLGNTQMTSLSTSNYVAASDLTLVASNKTLNPSTTGWKTIMFDTPFVYDGSSNLVVAVDNNTGSFSSFSFKAHTATTGNAVYWYQDGSNIDPTSPSASNSSTTTTVPDIRLSINCGDVTCPAPLVALGSVNQHDATLVWNAGGTETEWTVEYKLTTETAWTTAVANTTATTYTINGLNAGQYYNFRVGALCSGETSYGSVSGFTQCDVFTVPYYENFDASTELNPCWKAGNTASSTNIPYINSGSLYGTYTAGGWVILPEFDQPINSLQLSFISEYTSSSTPQIAIGVVSDPANINSMTVLQTLNIAQGEEEQLVYFDGYTGTGNIAIKFLTSYIYIDDLAVEVAPSCHKVTGVHVTATTNNSATLEWNSHTAANYEIRYKTADGAWQSTVVNSNPATVTGLQDASDYVFQVRAICTVGDSSVWSLETTTQTLCNPIVITAEQSHLESFEGSSLPICWEATSTSTTYKWDNITNSYSGNGMYFRDYNGYNGTLISPLFDCSSLNNGAQLRFWYQNPLGDDDVPVTLDVMYRTDGGEWQTIGTAAITTAHADWTEAEVVLPNSQNAANYQIALKATSTTYYEYCYLYLDEFMVEARPTCTRPTDLTLVTAGATTATISWTSDAAAATVQYRRANTSNWTTVQATGNSVTLSGLSQSTTYEVQVSANCSETDQSPYSNIYTFNTNCYDNAIATFPWVEGFENGIMCWQQQTITGNDLWVTQTGDGDGSYHQIDRAYSGSKNATFYSPSLTTNNSTRIISPALNITSLNNPYLKFAHAQTAYSGVNDKLMLYYRASASSNWVSLTSFTSAIANWTVDSIALPGASAEYQIAFVGTFMGGNGVIIDQVTVYNNSSAPGPNPPQGIEEAEGSMNLSIYPNPASGSTTITIDGVNGKLNVAVVDMNGRTVMSETVECNEGCTKQIDVKNLAQGAYFVRVNGETISTVKKLIVR